MKLAAQLQQQARIWGVNHKEGSTTWYYCDTIHGSEKLPFQ